MKRYAFLFLSLFLSGCIVAVVAGAAAGLVVYDKRSVSTIEKDTRIFHVIHSQIVSDPRFKQSRIEVISFNQVVLLLGQTPSATLRVMAEKIAQKTPTVRRVYNQISIAHKASIATQTKDSLITSQVRTYMLSRKGLESGSFRIVTEQGVVYLMGIVTEEQATIATHVAREIKGVKRVVRVFSIISL